MSPLIQPLRYFSVRILALFVALFASYSANSFASNTAPKPEAVVSHYADLAFAMP